MKEDYCEKVSLEVKKSRELREKIDRLRKENIVLTKQLYHIIQIYKKLI